jgi:hypothetical protein
MSERVGTPSIEQNKQAPLSIKRYALCNQRFGCWGDWYIHIRTHINTNTHLIPPTPSSISFFDFADSSSVRSFVLVVTLNRHSVDPELPVFWAPFSAPCSTCTCVPDSSLSFPRDFPPLVSWYSNTLAAWMAILPDDSGLVSELEQATFKVKKRRFQFLRREPCFHKVPSISEGVCVASRVCGSDDDDGGGGDTDTGCCNRRLSSGAGEFLINSLISSSYLGTL